MNFIHSLHAVEINIYNKSPILIDNLISDDYHLPEDDNHHSHRRGNLKSYNLISAFYKNVFRKLTISLKPISRLPQSKYFGLKLYLWWITFNTWPINTSETIQNCWMEKQTATMIQASLRRFSESLSQLYWHVSIIHVPLSSLMAMWQAGWPPHSSRPETCCTRSTKDSLNFVIVMRGIGFNTNSITEGKWSIHHSLIS
jgi:hypothetical protein